MVGGVVSFLLVMGLWTRWNSSIELFHLSKKKGEKKTKSILLTFIFAASSGGGGEAAGKENVCGELGAVVVCPHLPLTLTTMEEEEEEEIPVEEIKLFYQSIEENTLRRKELR